jgi:hypothetical protein
MMTKKDWPSLAEFARELARDAEPTGRVAAALAELGAPKLSLAERQTLARVARSEFGRPGGKARMSRLTPEQRSAFARLGGLARRGKGRKK